MTPSEPMSIPKVMQSVGRRYNMARLKDAVIEQIKTEVSLLRLVESKGHKPKPHGKAIACPFHEDDTASLIISPNNLFNCFGCGAAGSLIDSVIRTQGMSFRFACELLQKDIGLIADTGVAETIA